MMIMMSEDDPSNLLVPEPEAIQTFCHLSELRQT